eukprot:m.533583 g.533583  ORF g.533583 m.533583 type:complete len:119 (+) comp57598_c1_seq53:2772-3128(+)
MKVTSATSRPTGCGVPLGCCFYYQEALVFSDLKPELETAVDALSNVLMLNQCSGQLDSAYSFWHQFHSETLKSSANQHFVSVLVELGCVLVVLHQFPAVSALGSLLQKISSAKRARRN